MNKPQYSIDDRNKLQEDANKYLDKNLPSGEKVKVIIQGLSDSAIIGTDTCCFVYKQSIVGGVGFGSRITPWDYANLDGVHLETGPHSGVVSLQGPGTTSNDMNYWNERNDGPAASPYELSLTVGLFEQAREGVVILRSLIYKVQQSIKRNIPPISIQQKSGLYP